MRRFAIIALCVGLLTSMLSAQELKAPPIDEAEQDQSFLDYRSRLIEAVVERDIETILSLSDEDIHLSFGGHAGHDAFREFLEVDPENFSAEYRHEAPAMREQNWTELETVLRLGGRFSEDGSFVAPYSFTYDIPEEIDAFEAMFVTGKGVALRDRPIRYGQVIGRLEYDVVRHLHWVSGTRFVEVERMDGTKGFVHSDYLRSAVDYRAIFIKTDDEWKMTTFIAGD